MTGQLDQLPRLGGLYGRAAIQGLRALRLPGRPTRPPNGDMSRASVSVAEVSLSGDRLARYRTVCGYDPYVDSLPPCYLHVVAFPLQLAILTAPSFPFRAIGTVHISNTIRHERRLSPADTVDLSVSAHDLRQHRLGRQFTLVTEARLASELVWREDSVFLSREPSGRASHRADKPATATINENPEPGEGGESQMWHLPGDLGRRYARVSGDRNPIHLYDTTARLFGFRRHIAHGMWTMARALADLTERLPDRFQADAAFKAPLPLPATVQMRSRDDSRRIDVEVMATRVAISDSPKPPASHLLATITRL